MYAKVYPASRGFSLEFLSVALPFSQGLVYLEEGSIAETSVKILIISASVLQFLILREEVELSNTRTAYVMHIPNTLSLTSARNNRK